MHTQFRRLSIRAVLLALVLAALAPVLSACDTTAGAGQDLSKAGQAITNSAERNKSK